MNRVLKDSLYCAKILLFGEYGIIEDSMGLSIPYNLYQGSFSFHKKDDTALQSNQHLTEFHTHLVKMQANGELPVPMNLEQMETDIAAGMSFESSIPQGFGVGSSGALVAAIYDKYAEKVFLNKEEIHKDDILKLKAAFGKLESYFHGKSSGLDPLICYLNLPVLIKSKEDVGTVGIPKHRKEGKGAIFLIDSGQPGQTGHMVSIFLEKMKHEGFRKMLSTQFKKHNDACIKSFLNAEFKTLFSNLKELSQLLFDNFKPMIPNDLHQLWEQGIKSNSYYLKLCGSGGGGFILGFAQDYEKAKTQLKDYQTEVIYTF